MFPRLVNSDLIEHLLNPQTIRTRGDLVTFCYTINQSLALTSKPTTQFHNWQSAMAVFSYIALNSACGSGSCSCSNGNSSDCSHGSSCGSCTSNGRTPVNECNSSGANGNCSTCGSPTCNCTSCAC
ncbi:hypothetical protein C356_06790 [Cryptococcus neoformans c45]|nr:hypothetical protein C356_06790 [Cryptococcus neoformans var. grubii c45]